MRKLSILLSTVVMLALLLTACGGQQTSTSVPSTNVPPVTAVVTDTMSATEAPTANATTTPSVPVTGENNPARLSNMMKMTLYNQNNEQVGQVQDVVLDLDNSRVAYLVVSTTANSNTVLVPWDSLQVQNNTSAGATGQGNGLVLLADPNFLSNAPSVDVNTLLPGMCQTAGNWDVDIRNFWATGTMPSSTQSANTPAAGNGTTTSGTVTGATATTTTGGTSGSGATATATTTSGTATGNTGSGNTPGQGQAQNVQGVVLASQVIGSMLTISPQGQGQVQGQATVAPITTATASTSGTSATATATTASGTAGTGGTGIGSAAGSTQATVQDAIIDPATGDLRYLVITTSGDNTRWIPIPAGFLHCDPSTNTFVLMISANALQNAPAFAEDQFPDTSTTDWDTEFSTFWQNNGGTGSTGGTGGTSSATETPTATATP